MQDFAEPYPQTGAVSLLASAFMELLISRVLPSIQGNAKFTLQYKLNVDGYIGMVTLSTAIKLTYADGTRIPNEFLLKEIINILNRFGEKYQRCDVQAIGVRAYAEHTIEMNNAEIPSRDNSLKSLKRAFYKYDDIINLNIGGRSKRSKKRYQSYIPVDKSSIKNKKLFIVADLETLLMRIRDTDENKSHVPYAGGYMMVDMDKPVNVTDITTFYAHDQSIVVKDFNDMSTRMLTSMIHRIIKDVQRTGSSMPVYFHNLSQFDGLMILSLLTKRFHNEKWRVDPIVRNDCIYSIKLYKLSKSGRKRLVLTFMDSCLLLKGKLADLAVSFTPELGGKGSLDHDNITVDKLASMRDECISYLQQDILITGAVMQRAKRIIWDEYGIDILQVLTISALALKIFRRVYHTDDVDKRIHIPDDNEEEYIRDGYYGGHTDVYKPYGENLHYYDVNSLYPSSMLEDMPLGKPRWVGELASKKIVLNDLFGFVKAFIICPKDIKRPFLPYRKEDGTIIFPTGKFLGVYFSEELKYAASLGYKVYPINARIFDRMESPFKRFVYDIYSKRLEAKAKGQKALDFILKMILNSLYGRFGINPESTTSIILSTKESIDFSLKNEGFIQKYPLGEDYWLVSFKNLRCKDLLGDSSNRPAYAAVQISAAVTAYARIRMHPFISRDDCYYTDTDSVVVENPLPEEEVSPTELGKFKYEYFVEKGIFLAPKSYMLRLPKVVKAITKFKGAGKDQADEEWFINQLAHPEAKKEISYVQKFSRNWRELLVQEKIATYTMGLDSKKRELVFDKNNVWVDTKPCHIGDGDIKSVNPTSYQIIMKLLDDYEDLRREFKLDIMLGFNQMKAEPSKKRKTSKRLDTPSNIDE